MKNEKIGVRLLGISKIYTDPQNKKKDFKAVDDISIDIIPGQFVTLLGPSGCGKTTTLRMISGFEEPDAGHIFVGENDVTHVPPNKRNTAMVFQNYALFPHYNVFDNVAYGLKIKKYDRKTIYNKVMAILELVELTGMEERYTNQMSGGQQQRVALARALVLEPSVLLFDEPLSNLDAKLRVSMRSEIRNIQRKMGITSVYVTHDQSEAMSISDSIIIMNKGIVEQIGKPHEVYQHPKNKFVANFIGEANFLHGKVTASGDGETAVTIAGVTITIPMNSDKRPGDDCQLLLRPEAGTLMEQGLLPCQVVSSTFMGSYQDYHLLVGGELVQVADNNPVNRTVFSPGENAFLDFSSSSIYIL